MMMIIIIIIIFSNFDGRHFEENPLHCYRKFTAVSQKALEEDGESMDVIIE